MKWIMVMVVMMIGCMGHHHTIGNYHYAERVEGVKLGETIEMYIDRRFGEMDRIEMEKAILQWNYAMNGYVKIEVVTWKFDMEVEILKRAMAGEVVVVMKIGSGSSLIRDEKGSIDLAFCDKVGGHFMYIVRNRLENEDIRGIMLHEVGHIMGSFHTEHGLMQPSYKRDEYQCIDRLTIWEVAKYRKIPADRLTACYVDN